MISQLTKYIVFYLTLVELVKVLKVPLGDSYFYNAR